MRAFVNGLLVVIAALAGTWSMLDKNRFTAACYYAAAFYFYVQLEKGFFKND